MSLVNPKPGAGQLWPPAPLIDEPPNDAKVWRYMDLPKFIDLLNTKELHLTRAALFADRFEGSYPQRNAVQPLSEPTSRLVSVRKKSRDLYYLNCWHVNEYESAVMWTLYGTKRGGIAIQSSYQALKGSIVEKELVDPVYLSNVRYIDFASDAFEGPRVDSDAFSAFMYKRKSFEHEKELRIVTTNGLYAASNAEDSSIRIVPGVRLSVYLAQLFSAC